MVVTFQDFKDSIDKELTRGDFRHGQAIMNCLAEKWPTKHQELVDTFLDCYYDDKKIENTMKYLEQAWDSQDNDK